MDESQRPTTRHANSVARSTVAAPEAKRAILEPLRPLCGCGCGEKLAIPKIVDRVSVDYIQRYWQKHPVRKNHYAVCSFDERLAELESLRPLCGCGCGERLEIPRYLLTGSKPPGITSVQNHWQRHPYKRSHGIWERRTQNFLAASEPLDAHLLGLVYGTLLGDGAICYPNSYSRFPRIAWTHGVQQREWMEYKAERLSSLRPKLWILPNRGYGEFSISCSTACHPQLCEVFDIVRPNRGSKVISPEWLARITSEGLAWWYMDDGSLRLSPEGSPQIQLHTEGYPADANQQLAAWLTNLGYITQCRTYRRSSGKRYSYLAMGAHASRKWLADLAPFAIPAMAYKFGEGRVCPPRWR